MSFVSDDYVQYTTLRFGYQFVLFAIVILRVMSSSLVVVFTAILKDDDQFQRMSVFRVREPIKNTTHLTASHLSLFLFFFRSRAWLLHGWRLRVRANPSP